MSQVSVTGGVVDPDPPKARDSLRHYYESKTEPDFFKRFPNGLHSSFTLHEGTQKADEVREEAATKIQAAARGRASRKKDPSEDSLESVLRIFYQKVAPEDEGNVEALVDLVGDSVVKLVSVARMLETRYGVRPDISAYYDALVAAQQHNDMREGNDNADVVDKAQRDTETIDTTESKLGDDAGDRSSQTHSSHATKSTEAPASFFEATQKVGHPPKLKKAICSAEEARSPQRKPKVKTPEQSFDKQRDLILKILESDQDDSLQYSTRNTDAQLGDSEHNSPRKDEADMESARLSAPRKISFLGCSLTMSSPREAAALAHRLSCVDRYYKRIARSGSASPKAAEDDNYSLEQLLHPNMTRPVPFSDRERAMRIKQNALLPTRQAVDALEPYLREHEHLDAEQQRRSPRGSPKGKRARGKKVKRKGRKGRKNAALQKGRKNTDFDSEKRRDVLTQHSEHPINELPETKRSARWYPGLSASEFRRMKIAIYNKNLPKTKMAWEPSSSRAKHDTARHSQLKQGAATSRTQRSTHNHNKGSTATKVEGASIDGGGGAFIIPNDAHRRINRRKKKSPLPSSRSAVFLQRQRGTIRPWRDDPSATTQDSEDLDAYGHPALQSSPRTDDASSSPIDGRESGDGTGDHHEHAHSDRATVVSHEDRQQALVKMIFTFASNGLTGEVARLLRDGVSPNVREPTFPNRTLLHYCADLEQWETMKVCLQHDGCDPNLPDGRGQRATYANGALVGTSKQLSEFNNSFSF